MKLLVIVLGCLLAFVSGQRVPIGGPGFGDPTPGGGGFNTLPATIGGGGRPGNVVGPGGTQFGGGGGGTGLASILPGILSFFRGKRDVQKTIPELQSRTKRTPQRFIAGFLVRPFNRPNRPPPSFFMPQVEPGPQG